MSDVRTIYVCCSLNGRFVSRTFKGNGDTCLACLDPMGPKDDVVLVPLGPGNTAHAQRNAAAGLAFNAVAVVLHLTCARGRP